MNLQCPHCGTAIAISGVQAGAQVRCGACAQVFLMPQHQPVQQPVQQIPIASHAPQQQSVNPNLSQCKDCGGTVSAQAASCPHCGTPNPCGTTGVLIIKRQHRKFVASLAKLEVTFNANPIGKLKNGDTRRWDVAPGIHKLGIGNQYPKEIDITINPNRETIVEFTATAEQSLQAIFGNRVAAQNESPIKILSIKNR